MPPNSFRPTSWQRNRRNLQQSLAPLSVLTFAGGDGIQFDKKLEAGLERAVTHYCRAVGGADDD
jgi:hypothetical protein